MTLRESMIFGLCNPLIDVSAHVDVDFLKKYNLKENIAVLGHKKNEKIYREMEKKYRNVEIRSGGSTQNTFRCISWLLKYPNVATFMGCVGKDLYAQIMMDQAKSVGLNVVYQYSDTHQTAKCAVLITGKYRTMVAHLDAANYFTIDHLNDPYNWSLVEKAIVHYVSGFFLTVCPEAIRKVAKYSHDNARVFCMNLSAPFVSQYFGENFKEIFPYVRILFGNNDEAEAFSEYILGVKTSDTVEIAKNISKMPTLNGNQDRIVIITQGSDPIIVAIDDTVQFFDVPKVPSEKIVDTNGAGDAFVGAFLAQYIKNEPLEHCVRSGIWLAGIVIQQNGCTLPNAVDIKEQECF